MAIIIHYIGNDGKLGLSPRSIIRASITMLYSTEECLIDFRELIGEHSGENMAAAVWETVEKFGLIGRVGISVISIHLVLSEI